MDENIKALPHWPLWGESPVNSRFPPQRASKAGNVSSWWRFKTSKLAGKPIYLSIPCAVTIVIICSYMIYLMQFCLASTRYFCCLKYLAHLSHSVILLVSYMLINDASLFFLTEPNWPTMCHILFTNSQNLAMCHPEKPSVKSCAVNPSIGISRPSTRKEVYPAAQAQ